MRARKACTRCAPTAPASPCWPGTATFVVRAFDRAGAVTHEGRRTVDVAAEGNPPLVIRLGARGGDVPIEVVVVGIELTLAPDSARLALNDTLRIRAAATTADGDTLRDRPDAPLARGYVIGGSASVDQHGLVYARGHGVSTVVATVGDAAATTWVVVDTLVGTARAVRAGW